MQRNELANAYGQVAKCFRVGAVSYDDRGEHCKKDILLFYEKNTLINDLRCIFQGILASSSHFFLSLVSTNG